VATGECRSEGAFNIYATSGRVLPTAKPYFDMMGNVVEKLREMGRIK
jgi:hypothetical protein